MQRIWGFTLGGLGILIVAFVVVRSTFPCALPGILPGVNESCRLLEKKRAAASGIKSLHRVPTVTVTKIIKRRFVDRVFVTGALTARREVIADAQVRGLKIVEVLAKSGDIVKAGQVLAKLDQGQLNAALAQSDAGLRQTDAVISQTVSRIHQLKLQLKQQAADLKRSKALGTSVIPQANIDRQSTKLNIARSHLDVAREEQELAKANKAKAVADRSALMLRIKNTKVVAPTGGVISYSSAKLGAISGMSPVPLFTIVADMEVDLQARLAADKMAHLKKGMPASILVSGMPHPLEAHVRSISQMVDEKSHIGTVSIALPKGTSTRIGSFASGFITVRERDGFGIPVSAIQTDEDGETFVQLVEENTVKIKKIKVGVVNDNYVEVKEGLQKDDLVIMKASPFLLVGAAVRIKILDSTPEPDPETGQGAPGEQT